MKKLLIAFSLVLILAALAFAGDLFAPQTVYNLSLTNASRTGTVALTGYKKFIVKSDADVKMTYGTGGGSGAGYVKVIKDTVYPPRIVATDKLGFTAYSSATPATPTIVSVEVE